MGDDTTFEAAGDDGRTYAVTVTRLEPVRPGGPVGLVLRTADGRSVAVVAPGVFGVPSLGVTLRAAVDPGA